MPDSRVGVTFRISKSFGGAEFVKVLYADDVGLVIRVFSRRPDIVWSDELEYASLSALEEDSEPTLETLSNAQFDSLEPSELRIARVMTNAEMQAGGAALRARGGELAADVRRQVEGLSPSRYSAFEIRAAEATLASGEVLARVAFVERSAHSDLLAASREHVVEAGSVVSVSTSPLALPAAIASELYDRPETSMGGRLFVLRMRDGVHVSFETGEFVDFPGFPDPYDGADVEAACSEGEAFTASGVPQQQFAWCVY